MEKNSTNKQKETSTRESVKSVLKGIEKLKEISRHLTETEVLPTFEAIEESLDKRTPSAVERKKKPVRVWKIIMNANIDFVKDINERYCSLEYELDKKLKTM